MRSCSLALLALVAACDTQPPKGEPAPKITGEQAPQKPAQRLPPPDKPLPALSADRGGATGKAQWGLGLGGLGSDAPRAIAVDGKGDVVVVGVFDGEMELGPNIKRASAGGSMRSSRCSIRPAR